ncbi:MAG: hypothetical protein IJ180_01695 [Bacteroidales bacterium]|nr:hypothetical protein [Bacteroidales bacterium]
MIPTIIENICQYLQEKDFSLSSNFTDGRINSSVNEEMILNLITQKFDIVKPRAREWFDFAIEDNDKLYPVNIKITDTTHTDNLSCKLGIYYALTGLLPDIPNETSWEKFFAKLYTNIGKYKDRNYYFLIVNKSNYKDVFVNSLKDLQEIYPNGNNLPFQCKWNINRNAKNRTFEEAKNFLLTTFGNSIKLRSNIYLSFQKYFPEYV